MRSDEDFRRELDARRRSDEVRRVGRKFNRKFRTNVQSAIITHLRSARARVAFPRKIINVSPLQPTLLQNCGQSAQRNFDAVGSRRNTRVCRYPRLLSACVSSSTFFLGASVHDVGSRHKRSSRAKRARARFVRPAMVNKALGKALAPLYSNDPIIARGANFPAKVAVVENDGGQEGICSARSRSRVPASYLARSGPKVSRHHGIVNEVPELSPFVRVSPDR